MGESEWADLDATAEVLDRVLYRYRQGYGYPHCLRAAFGDVNLSDAELDALAAHAPAVKALVEATQHLRRFLQDADRVRVQSRCLTADLEFEVIARAVDAALAALDPATPEVDDARQ